MRTAALLVAIVWIAGSIYFVIQGYRARKGALSKLEDERSGRVTPEIVKAEAQMPKSLQDRLAQIAPDGPDVNDGPDADDNSSPRTGVDSGASTPVQRTDAQATAQSIFDAPPPGESVADGIPTIAEALTGVTLPYDLVPIVVAGASAIDHHNLAFITRGYPPTDIALGLRDVLLAAGFEVLGTGEMTATATHGSTTLHLEVHEAPNGIMNGLMKRFPSATIDSVVVEISSV